MGWYTDIISCKYNEKNEYNKFLRDLSFLPWLDKNIKILEIGCSFWRFTAFIKKLWFKSYTWIDIELDNSWKNNLEKKFPWYFFYRDDACHFLENTKEKFDVIYMAHVFEHLSEEEAIKAIKLIHEHLNIDWYYINYMPNAACLKWCMYMYHDITHKRIYDTDSFEQISYMNNIQWTKIHHKNTIPVASPFFVFMFKCINPIFVFFSKIYYFGMWYLFPRIYSSEILSIMRK